MVLVLSRGGVYEELAAKLLLLVAGADSARRSSSGLPPMEHRSQSTTRSQRNAGGPRRARPRQRWSSYGDPSHIKSPSEAKAFVDAAIQEFGRLDILVNSAGKFHIGPILSMKRMCGRSLH